MSLILSLSLTSISRVVEFNRAEPLEGRLPASLLADVHLLYEAKTCQHVGDVVQSSHLSCRNIWMVFSLEGKRRKGICIAGRDSFFLTFIFAVARRVLTLLDEDLGCCVQSDGLRFRHQEQHDKLLTHDAQRFVFPVAASYE